MCVPKCVCACVCQSGPDGSIPLIKAGWKQTGLIFNITLSGGRAVTQLQLHETTAEQEQRKQGGGGERGHEEIRKGSQGAEA